ncbi:MAG: chemotaxis protein CheD [Deltaproteobacteria bacterium]|nr:chemotaxis protein CheD [Deltaproteobacteria bacterium]
MYKELLRNTVIVGIADMKTSSNQDEVLVTYSLGSCIGVAIHDPVAKVGGLLHYMLPESQIDTSKAKANPFMFADTGIPLLFRTCYAMGAKKNRLVVKVAGGSQIMDETNFFNIGRRNYEALVNILSRNNVRIVSQTIGGVTNRTMRLNITTGQVLVKMPGEEMVEL